MVAKSGEALFHCNKNRTHSYVSRWVFCICKSSNLSGPSRPGLGLEGESKDQSGRAVENGHSSVSPNEYKHSMSTDNTVNNKNQNTILVGFAGSAMSSRKNAPYALCVFFLIVIGNFSLRSSDSKPLSRRTRASSPARAFSWPSPVKKVIDLPLFPPRPTDMRNFNEVLKADRRVTYPYDQYGEYNPRS